VLHHGDLVSHVLLREEGRVGQPAHGGGGLLETAVADHPPGRVGAEVDDAEEGNDPDPLDDKGESPACRKRFSDPGLACFRDQRNSLQSLWMLRVAVTTPDERRMPTPQHRLT